MMVNDSDNDIKVKSDKILKDMRNIFSESSSFIENVESKTEDHKKIFGEQLMSRISKILKEIESCSVDEKIYLEREWDKIKTKIFKNQQKDKK